MDKVEQLYTVTVDSWAFTLVGISTVRVASLVVYAIIFGFYLDALPDRLNLFEGVLLLSSIAYCSMVGFNPSSPYDTLRDKMPVELFMWTPLIMGLCSLGIAALRYHQTSSICPSCPTYVASGKPDCVTNPYAPTSTMDWTNFDSYDPNTLLQSTVMNNPQSNLEGDPILDSLPQCWYLGCSDCHPRYGWHNWLLIGTIFDCLCSTTFGFALVLIKHLNGY